MVKQLAFHKMFNRPGVCYESAQTRKFQLGRTEVIRGASKESKAWAEAMLSPAESVRSIILADGLHVNSYSHFRVQDTRRAALFRRAISRHVQYAAWAADGQGVDRHLFGLKKLLKPDEPVPSVYTDSSFSKSNHWELSTSNLSSEYFAGWGYGEGMWLAYLKLRALLTYRSLKNSRSRRLWPLLLHWRQLHPMDHYEPETEN